mgnify:CR=1 FL=1
MNLNTISQIVFYIGISVGIVCASKLPIDSATYPDTLFPFLVSIFISILGLVGWRRTSVSNNTEESATSPDNPQKLLADLKIEMDTLSELQIQKRPLEEIQTQVKKIIESFLIPISSRQQSLYRDLGMERAAHILITLSYVQRILHRFQSALSDGYDEEAQSCISEAVEGYLEL